MDTKSYSALDKSVLSRARVIPDVLDDVSPAPASHFAVYFGFFLFSCGLQLLLCNPVGAVLGPIATMMFLRPRIMDEEAALRRIFSASYDSYRDRIGTYLPGIP